MKCPVQQKVRYGGDLLLNGWIPAICKVTANHLLRTSCFCGNSQAVRHVAPI